MNKNNYVHLIAPCLFFAIHGDFQSIKKPTSFLLENEYCRCLKYRSDLLTIDKITVTASWFSRFISMIEGNTVKSVRDW